MPGFYGQGPKHECRDYLFINSAKNRREAISLSAKLWLSQKDANYCRYQKEDHLCPFTGIKAYTNEEYDMMNSLYHA